MTNSPEIKNERSVEVLLDRLDDLPSPSAVATRLMAIIDGDAVSTRDVIDLISTDPALSARVVGLCARSPRGRALGIRRVHGTLAQDTFAPGIAASLFTVIAA